EAGEVGTLILWPHPHRPHRPPVSHHRPPAPPLRLASRHVRVPVPGDLLLAVALPGMQLFTCSLVFFFGFTLFSSTAEARDLSSSWVRLPPEPRSNPLPSMYHPSGNDPSDDLLSLLYDVYPAHTATDMVPREREEPVFGSQGEPKKEYFPQPDKRSTVEGTEDKHTHKPEEDKRNKRSVDNQQEGEAQKDDAPPHTPPAADNYNTQAWWWPFVRRSPFTPRLGKRGYDLDSDNFTYDNDDLASLEYLQEDPEDYLVGGNNEMDEEMWPSPVLSEEEVATAAGSPDKRADFAFSPRLGKKADFAFSPRLGKKADFAFSPRLGKKADFAFSPRLGKKADFAFSPRLGKKADFAFNPRLGKRADFAFRPRLGKKADFAFSPRLGKKADFAFSPRLGKKADFAFSPRLGKKADFAFNPRLGKKADFAFSPRLGKREREEDSGERQPSRTQAYISRPSRPYFSPRLG
ncbi:hypothetical protein OTU49_005319, partial [Cherax quadricarinatus]